MLRHLGRRKRKMKSVCLAGGVAFNCVCEWEILGETPFESVYVHPAAGDAGLAVGAALYVWHQDFGQAAVICDGARVLGAGYSLEETRRAIDGAKLQQNGYAIAHLKKKDFWQNAARLL